MDILLENYGEVLSNKSIRRIGRKRRVCRLRGHLWYAERYDTETGLAELECRRCWPHKDSILHATLYDLMPTPETNGDR